MSAATDKLLTQGRWLLRNAVARRWTALAVSVSAFAVAMATIWHVADRYEAHARVYVDTQTVLKPLMAGLTYQPDIDHQVSMLARTLVSRPNMERLVAMPGLGLDHATEAARDASVTLLIDKIKIVPAAAGNLYDISYRGNDPQRAKELVRATVDFFVSAGLGEKRRDSQDAGRFIDAQIQSSEATLVASEDRLKDFKLRHFGVSGVSNADYFSHVSTLTDEVDKLRVALGAVDNTRESYRRELASEQPQLGAEQLAVATTGVLADIAARLNLQRKSLDDLLRRDTEAHPDVIGARQTIRQLEAELADQRALTEVEAGVRLSKDGPAAATNPVYQKLRLSLAESDAERASLRSQLGMLERRLADVRALAGQAPQVEAELAQLNRDYDVIRKNYDLLVARRESAALGAKLDESSQMAAFRVIEPPQVSAAPVFPSRLHLTLIAVVGSLLAGLLAAAALATLRPTVDDAADLRLLTGRPLLGTVSLVVTPALRDQLQSGGKRFAASAAGFLAVQALVVAWIVWKPMASSISF